MKKLIFLFAITMGCSIYVSAQTTTRVTKKQINQNVRIAEGISSGELTRREAKVLKRQQRHIRNEKRLAKADGVVTRSERASIRQDQRIASRSIYRQKNDVQSRH